MQIYFPFTEPLAVAQCLTESDLKAQIEAMKKTVANNKGPNTEWLDRCRICYEKYAAGDMNNARWWNYHATLVRPDFITEEFCNREKGRLYKRAPKKYEQFHDYSDGGKGEKA